MALLELNNEMSSSSYSPEFNPYTGVKIYTGKEDISGEQIVYVAGNDSGVVLEIENEWGSQLQADDILSKISGRKHVPIEIDGVKTNPTVTLGDVLVRGDKESSLCIRATNFGELMSMSLSSPGEQEIDGEYTYESPSVVAYRKTLSEISSELKIQATEISAKVESVGGDKRSFGWILNDTSFNLYSNGKCVLKIDENGLNVTGNGVFTGTIHANAGEFTGAVDAYDSTFKGTIYASAFYGPNGAIASTSDISEIMGSYVSRAIGGGINFDKMQNKEYTAENVKATSGSFDELYGNELSIGSYFYYGSRRVRWTTSYVLDTVDISYTTTDRSIPTGVDCIWDDYTDKYGQTHDYITYVYATYSTINCISQTSITQHTRPMTYLSGS